MKPSYANCKNQIIYLIITKYFISFIKGRPISAVFYLINLLLNSFILIKDIPRGIPSHQLLIEVLSLTLVGYIFFIILLGTFLRTVSIDSIVREFIKTNVELDKKYQIISLGAGFDTRLFRFMDEFGNKLDGLKYFEIDFDQVIREKKRIVEKKPILKELSASWRPISFDLNAGISDEIFGKDLDPSVPALIIAECCLMYLTADAGDKIISWSGNTFKSTLTFCSFDPILSDDVKSDPFSKVMLENFEKRGLDTRSLLEYPSRNSAIDRFKKRFSHVDSFTMFQLETTESLVSKQQRRDVLIKAALDEYEEWNLLAEHYLLILARNQHQHKQ